MSETRPADEALLALRDTLTKHQGKTFYFATSDEQSAPIPTPVMTAFQYALEILIAGNTVMIIGNANEPTITIKPEQPHQPTNQEQEES